MDPDRYRPAAPAGAAKPPGRAPNGADDPCYTTYYDDYGYDGKGSDERYLAIGMKMGERADRSPQGPALVMTGVSKTYASVTAVSDLSLSVDRGEIFGLLGPNGAGKTTTIRMILDIIKPSTGQIEVLGGPMCEEKKARIGYLPEERGLYQDMALMDVLIFLGRLKGMTRSHARENAERYLRIVDLWEARERKMSALSRGMNQKAQVLAAIMHEPELILVDEPFSGLDPVNTRTIKQLFFEMRERGAAIVMSTHQMNQVEEMCERILLIDRGHQVLYGPLNEIRDRFADNTVEVEMQGQIDDIPGVAKVTRVDGAYRLMLEDGVAAEEVLKTLVQSPQITVNRFERVRTPLDEIFVRVVERDAGDGNGEVAGAAKT